MLEIIPSIILAVAGVRESYSQSIMANINNGIKGVARRAYCHRINFSGERRKICKVLIEIYVREARKIKQRGRMM
jgi:hypothetical protein